MPTTILVPTMGASLIGVFISTFLYGVTSLQTYLYFERYWHKDTPGLKYTVVLLWLLETVHTGLACAFMFRLLVLNFGDFPALLVTTVSDDVTHGILAAIIFVVHCFYIRRLWVFTKNIYLTGLVLTLAVCHFAFEMVTMAILFMYQDFKQFHRTTPYFTTAMVMAVSADIIIAWSMASNLKAKQHRIKETNSLLNRLVTYVISTGVLTSVMDVVILSTFLAMPDNLVYLCFLNFVNNFYSNSMLALLNARQSLRLGSGKTLQSDIAMDSMNTRDQTLFQRSRSEASKISFKKNLNDTEIEISKTVETDIV